MGLGCVIDSRATNINTEDHRKIKVDEYLWPVIQINSLKVERVLPDILSNSNP